MGSDEAELAALEPGEAEKNVEVEIEKGQRLLGKYRPGSDEHRLLSRRIAMLKRLKDKMGR
jgi:hypothetical protein